MSNWKLKKIQYGFTTTATSGGTLVLVFNSRMYQRFTGGSSHTLRLPNATTMKEGLSFVVVNNSTGTISVQNNGLVSLGTVLAGSAKEFVLTDNSISNGVWRTVESGESGESGIAATGPSATKVADYVILTSDEGSVINVDTSAGEVNVTLPAPSDGFNVTIKDIGGNALKNSIGIIRSSDSVKIDGEVNDDLLVVNYGSISYLSDGTDWFRVGSSTASDATGLFLGGNNGVIPLNTIDYVSLSRRNTALDFGDLTAARGSGAACASTTRGIYAGGVVAGPTVTNIIDFVEFKTLGNATDFGDLTVGRRHMAACSNSTRGLFAGGLDAATAYRNEIDYITIASAGNATDFGDLTVGREGPGGSASTVRAVFGGGNSVGAVPRNEIDYVTIASPGNAVDFGDLTVARRRMASFGSPTRGFWAGGNTSPFTQIDYVEFATLANATSFGDLKYTGIEPPPSAASRTIAVIGTSNTFWPRLQYINMATLSDSNDFGELSVSRGDSYGSCSNAHGGLQ